MHRIRQEYILAAAVTVVAALVSYWLQRFRLLELEECYIFLYDGGWVLDTVKRPGGVAQLLASFATQYMTVPWSGPLIVSLFYGLITLALCKTARSLGAASWTYIISIATVICLFLCLENNSYKFQGHAAVLIALLWLWSYTAALRCRRWWSLCIGVSVSALAYFSAGSAALVAVLGMIALDIRKYTGWGRLTGIAYVAVVCVLGWIAYRCQLVPTLKRALTPTMYYEWDTTSYMMLYAWISATVFIAVATIFSAAKSYRHAGMVIAALAVAQIGVGARMYTLIHNPKVYRAMTQRYYAKTGDWDAIIALDYGDEPTPFTSYRLLALAQTGRLGENLASTRPFIDYFMKNTTLVKKEDLEVLSDIWYACDYMAAARHFAFDTNIVTPGAFNPYETQKLAEINILTGDYGVAEKHLAQLEKTRRYGDWARSMRRFINNPEAVKADPVLSKKLAVIPEENHYMSPKGTLRDLRAIVAANPDQQVARQFLEAFITLTHYHD